MRVAIVKDEDSVALLEQLDLIKFKKLEHLNMDNAKRQEISDMHRSFHYHVCKWLQEQGLSTLRSL